MISVIIPTYKEPEYLKICLESIMLTQHNNNEIVIVYDGFYDLNKEVVEPYKSKLDINEVIFEENQGLAYGTNVGVLKSKYDKILIVNDDNVFPFHWDIILEEEIKSKLVISPNQVEPYPSMFKDFIIKDFGQDCNTFNLDKFLRSEIQDIRKDYYNYNGCTLPIAMRKEDWNTVGGWDMLYPSAHVVDWDFFLKCELADFQMMRTFKCNFYHFAGKGTSEVKDKETLGHEFFKMKWGEYAKHNINTNSKLLK